jgi:uncharacterized repeat protein (TIGR02543 family)
MSNQNNDNKKRNIIIIILIIILLVFFTQKCTKTSYLVTFKTYGNYNETLTTKNSKIAKPANPSRKGYTFVGWYYKNKLFNFNTNITKNITLTAKWKAIPKKTYNITFDSGGGTNVSD